MPYPLTITIDQTGDGRFRASYSDPAMAQSEPGASESSVTRRQAGVTRSIEADNFVILMGQLKDVLGPVLIRECAGVELALDADEDAEDLADARAAMEDVRKNGGTSWGQVDDEMGL